MYENRKRKIGDRFDGYRLRHTDPMFRMMPFIMTTRSGSTVYYELVCDITKTEDLIRQLRKEGHKDLSYTHLVMAAITRTIAEHPKLNRYVSGRRVYARSRILFSLIVKDALTDEGKEYATNTEVEPTDSIFTVADKLNEQVANITTDNGTDNLLNFFGRFPRGPMKASFGTIRLLDYFNILPKGFANDLPFYSSVFITNIGSLGGDALYHHLYDFGTVSLFVGMGNKRTVREIQADGSIKTTKQLTLRITADERICEGYDFICAMKTFKYYLENAKPLTETGTVALEDDEI